MISSIDKNAIAINKFVFDHRNELVIDQHEKVSRLIDCEDGGDDYYWVLKDVYGTIHRETCVGGLIVLEGKIDEKDYKNLELVFILNDRSPDGSSTV